MLFFVDRLIMLLIKGNSGDSDIQMHIYDINIKATETKLVEDKFWLRKMKTATDIRR